MFRFQGMQPHSQQNPLVRILVALLLVVAAAVAVVFGVIIVAVLLGAAVIFFAFLYLRAWWLRRKLGLNLHPPHHHSRKHDNGTTIEGEYTIENGSNKDKR
ncbi:MAG: hypothetical protein ACRESE_06930 [Gammaproteobacteria bacterium]